MNGYSTIINNERKKKKRKKKKKKPKKTRIVYVTKIDIIRVPIPNISLSKTSMYVSFEENEQTYNSSNYREECNVNRC